MKEQENRNELLKCVELDSEELEKVAAGDGPNIRAMTPEEQKRYYEKVNKNLKRCAEASIRVRDYPPQLLISPEDFYLLFIDWRCHIQFLCRLIPQPDSFTRSVQFCRVSRLVFFFLAFPMNGVVSFQNLYRNYFC